MIKGAKLMNYTKDNIGDFRSLIVYQKSAIYVKKIYEIVNNLPAIEKYNIADQMRRAVSSVTANIAEGYARISYKEEYSFLNISVGSISEVRSFLDLCLMMGYISEEDYKLLDKDAEEILKMLIGKMQSIRRITG